ncbi:MAG: DUF3857 domain-containing protein, partial [Bacteroidetes bacterium]|nr:DUF3857 domain-containing protein [Bacteroidota bacterium]
MKNLFILLISLVIGLCLEAQPASDAVFEKITKDYTLNDDGSVDLHFYKKLKLLTHLSFNRQYGETFIVYNPRHQTLKINKAVVTQKNGNVVVSPANAFNEVLPQFAADAPAFNHLREMVVTHAGVELDAVIELDYTLHTDKGYYPALMGDEILTTGSPVNEEIITLTIPEGKNLNYKVFNIRTAPEISEAAGGKVYRFMFRGIEENSHESNQPQSNDHLPRLIFSTITWKEAQQFISGQQAFQYKVDESMSAVVKQARSESKDDRALILKLQAMAAGEINTYPVPGEFTGFTCRPPVEVWKSNGGTPLEKCLLLTALIRAAKINAEPMAVIPTPVYDENSGCLISAEYLVQASPREYEQMILSGVEVGSQNLIYSLNGKTTLVLNPEKPAKTVVNEKFENMAVMSAALVLDDSLKLKGTAELAVYERANPYYRIKNDSAATKQFIGGGLSAGDIQSFKLVNAAQTRSNIRFEIESKKPLRNQAGYYFFDLPVCKNGSDNWHITSLNAERVAPFEIPFPVNEQYGITIDLPDEMTLVNPLALTELKTNFGELVL